MKASRNGPVITHLMFAYDLLLFNEASKQHVDCVMECINNFCDISGQKVNKDKTNIFFSRNVRPEIKNDSCCTMGFKNSTSLRKYLGVPLHNGRVRRDKYRNIIDKIKIGCQVGKPLLSPLLVG